MNKNQIVAGSVSALAQQNNASLAESFLSVDIIIIVDVSGSMSTNDSRGGKSRFEIAMEELANLQKSMPGKIGVVAFDDHTQFCPGGIAMLTGGGTDLAGALYFAKVADVPDMKFILISDGEPDDRNEALKIAKTYTNHIDVIFVGPEDRPAGRDFLHQLAKATGGQAVTADRAQALGTSFQHLLKG